MKELYVITTSNNEMFYCGKHEFEGKSENIISDIVSGICQMSSEDASKALETIKKEGFAVGLNNPIEDDRKIPEILKTLQIKNWSVFIQEWV